MSGLAFDAHQAMCSVFASLILASLSDDSSAVNQTLLHTEKVLAIVLCCLVCTGGLAKVSLYSGY